MADKENEFKLSEQQISATVLPTSAQPHTLTNLQHIRINDISGPLVVLFGPRDVGKTVTLLRLCNYIRKYEVKPHENFRTDKAEYKRTTDAFEGLRQDFNFAPGATGAIDFLLLDVTYQGNMFCQLLEAPGEHFFDAENPNRAYPSYFNQILNSDYRKIFVFFFELNMFESDQDRKNYADKIARLASEKIRARRDRVIIVCNKSDLQSQFFRDGRPVEREFRDALYRTQAFSKLLDVLSKSGYGRIPFVPFSAGSFTDDGVGRFAFALSPDLYPVKLWEEIRECVEGKPWWKFW